jgi:hypothetical protein
MVVKAIEWKGVDWVHLVQGRVQLFVVVNVKMNIQIT